MKIATVNTITTGGAAIAALRLHNKLNDPRTSVHSNFIQRDPLSDNDSTRIFSVPRRNSTRFIDKIKRKIGITDKSKKHIQQVQKMDSGLFECASFVKSPYSLEASRWIQEADVLHLHWVSGFLNYKTFFKNVRQPIVWTLHDMNPFQGLFHYKNDEIRNAKNLGKIDKEIRREKKKSIHQHSNIHVVCLCEWMKSESQNSEILGKYPHYIIPNGIDFNNFPILDKRNEKQKLHIDNDDKTLMFIAEDIHNHRKGFDLLLDALNSLQHIPLNIITVGGIEVVLPSNFNHLHFNRVSELSKLNQLYTAADLVVLASREDNLPNVMLEAFANGTPVISFQVGGMKDWIIPNQTGLLISQMNSSSLANGLESFIVNENAFSRKYIREYAFRHFNIDSVAKQYIDLFSSVS